LCPDLVPRNADPAAGFRALLAAAAPAAAAHVVDWRTN